MPFLQRCKKCREKKPCNRGYCQTCYPEDLKIKDREKKREKTKQYNKKTLANQIANRKPTGEWGLFVKIWLKRPHECTGCGEKLYVMTANLFSHTVRQNDDDTLLLEEDNIEIECQKCHTIWDQGLWKDIIKQKNFVRRMSYIKRIRPDLYARKALKILEFTGVDITMDLKNQE